MDVALLKGHPVWRVGRFPDPWAWAERQYSGNNRWDDADGNFRTIYAGDSLFGCFVELLAFARPDTHDDGSSLLSGIEEDPEDAAAFPTKPPGYLPPDWLGARMKASGELRGEFADVRSTTTIADLRPAFLQLARELGFPDFDAAALKLAYPRELTQRVATRLYTATDSEGNNFIDGVRFASRHGDDLPMWAVFERPEDTDTSRLISDRHASPIDPHDDDFQSAMKLHGLNTALN